MNRVCLAGRLTKNIELRYTMNGKEVADFSIAISRGVKNAEGIYETDFINIQVWGNKAKTMAEYCKKGDMIGIDGSLRHESYETEQGKRTKDYVLAERIMFLSPKKE